MSGLHNYKFKGTVTYLSDVITAITSMFFTLFMLFISALVVFIMHVNITSTVYGDVLYDVPVSGMYLNAILDSQNESMQIKDLLADAVWFGSEKFKIGKTSFDLKTIFTSTAKRLGVYEYSANLQTGEKNILLAKSGAKQQKELKCSEYKIFAQGKSGTLNFCASRVGK